VHLSERTAAFYGWYTIETEERYLPIAFPPIAPPNFAAANCCKPCALFGRSPDRWLQKPPPAPCRLFLQQDIEMTSPTANTSDFDYSLPEERIALHPLPERTAAKLLVTRGDEIFDQQIKDLPGWLPQSTAIFVNNTKVVHARLLFPLGERTIEIFCLGAADGRSIDHVLQHRGEAEILAMVGGAKRWKQGALTIDWRVGAETIALSAFNGQAPTAWQKFFKKPDMFRCRLTFIGRMSWKTMNAIKPFTPNTKALLLRQQQDCILTSRCCNAYRQRVTYFILWSCTWVPELSNPLQAMLLMNTSCMVKRL
jgi:hypothetical protein